MTLRCLISYRAYQAITVISLLRRFHTLAAAQNIPNRYRGYWDLILEQPHSAQFDPTILHHENLQYRDTSFNTEIPEAFLKQSTAGPSSAVSPAPVDEKNLQVDTIDAFAAEELARLVEKEKKLIPPVPPENCCMSGCVHCVWDLYQEEMEEYQLNKNKTRDRRRQLLLSTGREQEPDENEETSPQHQIDPGLAAFLAMEKALQAKK